MAIRPAPTRETRRKSAGIFADIEPYTVQSGSQVSDYRTWENVSQGSTPMWIGIQQFINANPCWWNSCVNFLLKRDLDPSSNDNTPLGLNKVA
jgi:hypothetical protein